MDPQAEAEAYLKKHNIELLFQHLGSKLLFAKPDDPNEFLVAELEAVQAVRAGEENVSTVDLFTEADLRAMFSMYDVTRKGVISKEQFVSAIQAVGVDPSTVDIIPNTIEENSFVRILTRAIANNRPFLTTPM